MSMFGRFYSGVVATLSNMGLLLDEYNLISTQNVGLVEYGRSVGDDEWCIVEGYNNSSESLHIFRLIGNVWTFTQYIDPPERWTQMFFGDGVLVVSHWFGSKTIYTQSGGTWTAQQTITTPLPPGGIFGQFMAVTDTWMTISSDDTSQVVEMYKNIGGTWTYHQTFTGSLKSFMVGDHLIIDKDTTLDCYTDVAGTWTLIESLNVGSFDIYQMNANYLLTYDQYADTPYTNSGACKIYERDHGSNTWINPTVILSPNPGTQDGFGSGVLNDNYVLMYDIENDPESLFYFENTGGNNWSYVQKVTPSIVTFTGIPHVRINPNGEWFFMAEPTTSLQLIAFNMVL